MSTEHVLLNSCLVDLDRLSITHEETMNLDEKYFQGTANAYDGSSKKVKFNSFPMRLKKTTNTGTPNNNGVKLKSEPKSSSSIEYKIEEQAVLPEEELDNVVGLAFTRAPENAKLKQFLRNNYWSFKHPIRNYLWKCLLKQPKTSSNSKKSISPVDKENNVKNEVYCNESDYNKHLNHIFGKCNTFY